MSEWQAYYGNNISESPIRFSWGEYPSVNLRTTEGAAEFERQNAHRIKQALGGHAPGYVAAKPLTEAAFMQAIVNYARHEGWLCYHTYNSKRSEPGFPDLVLLKDGQHLVAEVKTQEGKITRAQGLWLAGFRQAGVEAHVWRPDDWETIKERLEHGKRAHKMV